MRCLRLRNWAKAVAKGVKADDEVEIAACDDTENEE